MFCSLEHFKSYNLSYLAMNALHFTVHYIVVSCLQPFAIAFKNVRRTVQKMLQTLINVLKVAVINSTRKGAGRESAGLKNMFITVHQFAVWFNGPTKNFILVS